MSERKVVWKLNKACSSVVVSREVKGEGWGEKVGK